MCDRPGSTDLEARNTCGWGTLQVSTAQLLRYISPTSLRTLNAGRHGEKKEPILEGQGRPVSPRSLPVPLVLTPWGSHPLLKEAPKGLRLRPSTLWRYGKSLVQVGGVTARAPFAQEHLVLASLYT